MYKANKFQKNFFTIARVILFTGVLILLYFQIKSIDKQDWDSFVIEQPFYLILGIVLVYPNIGVAYLMWAHILKLIGLDQDRKRKINSFFAGLITGMLTPNMIGNFVGRLYYYEKEHRLKITGLTLLSNFAQFVTSLGFGSLALFLTVDKYFPEHRYKLTIGAALVLLFSIALYFIGEVVVKKEEARWGLHELREIVRKDKMFRVRLLGLSVLRFFIFSTQFYLILKAFDPSIDLSMIINIWVVYLLTMLTPSLFLGKLGIKESVALFVLSFSGVNEYAVLFTSLLIWFVNSLSPAVLALFICRKKEIE